MHDQALVTAQANAACTVTCTKGMVQVHDAALFGRLGTGGAGTEACSQFASSVFQWSQVRSLEIDGSAATATMRFAPRICRVTALRELAAAIEAGGGGEHRSGLEQILRSHAGERVRIFRCGDNCSTWEVLRQRNDAVVVQHPAAKTWNEAHRITAQLTEKPGVEGFRWRSLSRSLVILFDSKQLSQGELLMLLDESVLRAQSDQLIGRDDSSALAVGGIRRLAYLGLAAGSFGLSVLGVILPGLPTVPFLLTTSYFLMRSSPRLNARLLRSPTFGPMLRDWHEHGAMRPRVKLITIATMLLVFALTVTLAGLSLPLLMLVTLLILIGISIILRIPTISGDQESAATSPWPAQAARSLLGTVTA